MRTYLYILTLITAVLFVLNVGEFKVKKSRELNFGKHFKPKRHFLFEYCAKCGRRLKHYHWFWGKGDFMGCDVDYLGNTQWYCEECDKELDNNVLHKIPKN